MVKLNDAVHEMRMEKTQVNMFLVQVIQDTIRSVGHLPHIDYSSDEPVGAAVHFFENYYVRLDSAGSLQQFGLKSSIPISSSEADVLDFLLDKSAHYVPCIVLGREGVGKSTLLKYLSFYLWFKCPELRDLFLPVYLPISDFEHSLSRDDIFRELNKMIYERVFSTCYRYLNERYESILPWINLHSGTVFRGKFTDKVIKSIKQEGMDEYFRELSPQDSRQLIMDTLTHFSRHRTRIVLIVDDVDRHSYDIHRSCLNFLDKKIEQGFAVITAMRTGTYNEIDSVIFENTDRTTREVRYSIETVKNVLRARIAEAHKRLKLVSRPRIDASTQQLVEAFVNLLSNDNSIDVLSSLSNLSLDILFRKFRLILNSSYFDDSILTHELLHLAAERQERGAPVWVVYSLLFGNHAGTFKTVDEAVHCGIMNVFSSKHCYDHLLRHLIRLHLLSAFYSYDDNTDRYISVKPIYRNYCDIFGDEANLTEAFIRSMYRLVNGRLLYSEKCSPYHRIDTVREEIFDDMLTLSPAGRFYLMNLIHKVDYLYFMKDDINWLKIPPFSHATVGKSRTEKFCDTLCALRILMTHEYELLEKINEVNSRNSTREKNLVRLYTNRFSPLHVNREIGTVVFTKWMYGSFRNYITWTDARADEHCEEEFSAIDMVIERNATLEKVFLPQ